jgi:dTDP-4-dehydrorhamnose 3,5-epimerase-like enzyme
MRLNKKELKVNHKDSRGKIIDIFENKIVNHCTIVTFKKKSIRGNHFHKKSYQYALVIEGNFTVKEMKVKNNKLKKIITYKAKKNNFIEHKPYEAHAFKCNSKKGFLIIFTQGLRSGKDYEKDTFRLASPILK